MPRVSEPNADAIAGAAGLLRRGDVVAFPTETVYGLGGDALSPAAVRRIYSLKGRPPDNPLIVHVLNAAGARSLARQWDERIDRLAARFWPGPLTLVLRKAAGVPREVTAGRDTIAVRCPTHPVATGLLAAFGGPIAAPSANRSGRISPTTATHVALEFAGISDLLILDGGACAVGIESTVLDLSSERARILRPGSITTESLRCVIGAIDASLVIEQAASPGTAASHYAPRTPARLVTDRELESQMISSAAPLAIVCFEGRPVAPPHRAVLMPRGAEAYAARLYDALREADAMNAATILIENPEESGGVWTAIHDRLRRATSGEAHGRDAIITNH